MKSKLYSSGVVFISLLAFSCSNDDLEDNNSNSNIVRTSKMEFANEFNKQVNDSSTVVAPTNVNVDLVDGEPSNPKPPRN